MKVQHSHLDRLHNIYLCIPILGLYLTTAQNIIILFSSNALSTELYNKGRRNDNTGKKNNYS